MIHENEDEKRDILLSKNYQNNMGAFFPSNMSLPNYVLFKYIIFLFCSKYSLNGYEIQELVFIKQITIKYETTLIKKCITM